MKPLLFILLLSLSSCYITKQRDANGKKCRVKMERVKGKPEKRLGW